MTKSMIPSPEVAFVTVRDGTRIAVALYKPQGPGPFPVLFAAAPYRFDNNRLPASTQFMFRETGPIEFYVAQGYVYAHMDVRGSGRSEGEYELLGENEQNDLYDVIEWLGSQSWSNGKVGGIGQSYFCMSQWFMGVANPPSLACLGAYDGLNDPYRDSIYSGGLLSNFFPSVWWNLNRSINAFPAEGPPRELSLDLNNLVRRHPFYDDFWRIRSARERMADIRVPVYAIGIWSKWHRRGVMNAFGSVSGPIKMRLLALPNAATALRVYQSVEFHREVMLPFYDRYLKDLATSHDARPAVEYQIAGRDGMLSSDSWPPREVETRQWFLSNEKANSLVSLNDGTLETSSPMEGTTDFAYPQPGWVLGTVGFGAGGHAGGFDPPRHRTTFSTPPFEEDYELCGPVKLVLYLSSSNCDTSIFASLHDQSPLADADREAGRNPASSRITLGCLRASRRRLDPGRSTDMKPFHAHTDAEPLVPGEVYRIEIEIDETAYRIRKGHRLRLELVNGDSPITDLAGLDHVYPPSDIGEDRYYHGGDRSSVLMVSVRPA